MRILFLFCLIIFLIGCSPSITKQVDQFIMEGNVEEAVTMINEHNLTENEDTKYGDTLLFYELSSLHEKEEYDKLIKTFIQKPISDDTFQDDVILMLKNSFSKLLEKEFVTPAKNLYAEMNNEYKEKLQSVKDEIEITEKKIEAVRIEREKQVEKESLERFINLMLEQKYSTITLDTVNISESNRIGNNFYNLASAYEWFTNDNDDFYVFGLDSMPEHYLAIIDNPYPEIIEMIESLENLIYLRKSNSAKDFGVIIGMTKDQVLLSSWGKPQTINETTSTYGTREQWVYGNGHYLYFRDDILISISTRN